MTPSGTFSFDTPGDAERAVELRRVKALATLVLGSTLVLFVVAKWLLPVHPVFGFIAAFAEAATIGGLADWYAVVALFKRPLGLPIPHTAIIQSRRSISAPSSPTGCAIASAAMTSRALRSACCRRPFPRPRAPV